MVVKLAIIPVIPDHIHFITNSAFEFCKFKVLDLTGIGIEEIEEAAFKSSAIEKILLPKKLHYLGKYAFYGCLNLNEVVFSYSNSLLKIEDSTFEHCSSLTKIEIPSSIKTIGIRAFAFCTKLTNVVFQEFSKLEYIQKNSFQDSGIESLILPSSLKEIASNAFLNCTHIKLISINSKIAPSWMNNLIAQCITFPEDINEKNITIPEKCNYVKELDYGKINYIEMLTDDLNELDKDLSCYAYSDEEKYYDEIPSKRVDIVESINSDEEIYCDEIPSKRVDIVESINSDEEVYCDEIPSKRVDIVESINSDEEVYCDEIPSKRVDIVESINSDEEYYEKSNYLHKQANNIVEVSRRFRTYKPSKKNTINKNRDSKPKYSGFRINKLILPKNVNTLRLTKLKQLTEIDLSNTTSLSQIRLSNTKIESITIPDSVKLLEDGCFENCFQLTTVTFSDKSQCHTFGKKAFYKCGITSIELPKSLKLIGSFCFHECNQLNMIDLSKCHAKLSQNSISSCPSLTTLKIKKSISFAESSISDCENITTIEGSPIFNQTGLLIDQKSIYYCNKNTKSVTIPRNITLIPQKCFNFQNFRKITFENGSDCMVIGENAFSSSSVKKITIPDKTNIIQNYAFGNCTKLKSVILSNNLTRFGIFSFSLTNISSIEIPKSVEKIPIGCFYGCNNLKTVIFSKDNSIKKIGFKAFANCMSLESINIPYSPKVEIESMAFYNCKNLTKFDHIEKYEFILANYSRDAFLNTKIESFKLSINDYFCFSGLKSLKHVYFHIPVQDEKYIGIPNLAFSGTGIETIDLSGFYFIGDYAFQDCHELKSVVIKGQDQFYFIGNSAFLNCTSLETFEVPCIFHIGNSCFENCASFNSPLSTMNLNYIGKYAFRNSGVKSLSGNIKYIGKGAFQDCKSLQSFENSQNGNYDSDCFMNSSIESFLSSNSNFGGSCFENCQLLKKFTIEENLKEHWIDNNVYTFYQIFQKKIQRRERYYQSNPSFGIKMFQNSGIAEIEIPSDLCEVPSYCFYGCKKLQKVIFKSDYNIGSNIHEINSYAFAYSGLKSIVFPERLCSIRGHAFYNTLNLKNTTFDESIIEFIGTNAFGFSGIESVRFPTTIKEISSGAFSYCNNLRIVTFELNKCTIKIGDHAFMQCKNLATFECDNMVGINIDKSDPNYSFVGCSNLKTLNIKNNLYQSDDNKIIDGITYNKNMSKMLLMSSQIPNHLRFPRQFIKMPKHAFAFTLLTEVIFEKSTNITHLPNYAFYSTLIRKFVLPDTVKSIGCSCFEDCKDLKTFVISQESNLTSLGNYCFMNTAIKAIYIPQNVQKIPPYCFAKCNNLKSFSLSNYHKTNVICEYAFFKSGIEALKLPKKLIIENDAFSYCKLKTLFLENSQEINTCSFSNNPLESVYIKFNSKFFKEEQYKIDDLSNKFSSELSLCTNHQHRFLKPHDSSLCSLIDKLRNFFNAFLGCQNMKSFMLVFHYQGTIAISPKEYHNDNEQINNGCSPSNIDKMIDSILNHLVETRKRQLKYIPFEKVSDNNKFDPRSFSHNYHHRFNGNEFMFSQLFEITIPKQITKLNDKLFYGCTNLTKINFETHSTLHVIGEYCFVGTKIESIILPNWCHELRKGCFKDVSSLEHIECNEIHLLDDEALSGTSINSFIFNNLNFLGNSVFRECKCLTSIKHVNCNYQEIGMNCFENTNIKQFKLPPTVSIIRKNAFCGCSHLKKFNIPHSSSLLYIEGMAFTDTAIKSLNIPNTIAFIDQSAFVKTPNLTSIFANNEIDNPEYEIDSKTGAVYYLPLFERVKIKIPKRVPYNSKYNKNGEKNDKYDYLTVYEEKCDDEYPQEVIVYDTHCSYSNPRSCRNRFSSKYPQKYHKKHAKKAVKSDTIKKIYQHLKKILLLVPRNIQKFDVPKDVNEIGSSAFSGSIQKVKFIEPSITTILHKDSFACSNLEQIELPNSIKLIGESCFNGCQELRKVLFHGNFLELREIPQFCFSFCTSLESINLPISIRKIGSCAFNCCFNLRNVNLSQLLLLEEVNSSAFMQTSLEEILFPPKIKKIDKCSFSEIRTLHLVDFTKTIVNLCNDPRHEIFSSRNHHIVNYYFAQLKSLPKYRNNYISYLKHHPKNACFDYFYTRNHFNYLTFIDKFECADVDTFTTIIEEEKARKKESIEEEEYVVCEAQSDSYNDEYISYSRRPTRATQIKSVKFENCSFKNYYKKLNEINYIDEFSFAGSFANIVRLNENIIATEFFKHFGKIDLLEKPNVKFELKLQTNHYNNVLFTSKFRIRNYEIVNSSQCDIMTNQPINEIVLPESLKPIPYTNSQFLFPLHFHGCQQLTTVNFHPELKLENIPPYCFAFTNIETITFPRFLKTIDYNAFLYCTNLKMMTFTYLETSETENLNKLTIKNSFSGSGVEILDLRGYSVINIEESSFSGCKNLKKVIFGEKTQIQTIKKYSFAYSGLESFDFPESVEKIDEGAFDGCKLLETVNFNQNLNKIGQFAFRFTKINNVFIPKSVIEIGKGAFSNCLSLIKADFETHRKLQIKIQKGAFEYSSISSLNIPLANYFHLPNLKEVKFNENLLKKSQRFDQITHENGCITKKKKLIFIPTDIIELEIPAIVSKWKPNIFANCKKLEIIRFDKNSQIQVLHPIHSSTLKFIEIPASVSIICDCAFLGCNSLLSFSILTDEKIEGKSSLTQIGKRAFSETKVSEFKVPLNLKSIGESAFEKTNLASLVFDSDDDNSLKNYKLQVIGQKCFYESFLTSLSLPPSLTSIGKYAFYHSPHLRTVNFFGEPESSLKLGKHCFARADKRLVLNVQNGVKLNHFYGDNYKINLM